MHPQNFLYFIFTEIKNYYKNYIQGKITTYIKIKLILFGKFVPMLKENWNAENLNFSTYIY